MILFDIGSAYYKLDEWKHDFWNVANIGVDCVVDILVSVLFILISFFRNSKQ